MGFFRNKFYPSFHRSVIPDFMLTQNSFYILGQPDGVFLKVPLEALSAAESLEKFEGISLVQKDKTLLQTPAPYLSEGCRDIRSLPQR